MDNSQGRTAGHECRRWRGQRSATGGWWQSSARGRCRCPVPCSTAFADSVSDGTHAGSGRAEAWPDRAVTEWQKAAPKAHQLMPEMVCRLQVSLHVLLASPCDCHDEASAPVNQMLLHQHLDAGNSYGAKQKCLNAAQHACIYPATSDSCLSSIKIGHPCGCQSGA